MNLVFLSPHFPPNMYLYCQRLREAGVTVLGLADAAYDGLRPELREALTEYYRVDDLHDDAALIRAVGHFTHRYGKIDRIESLNEYWLETDARLRTEFNVPGIRAERIDRIKRKSAMKRVFERAGVRVARGRVIRTAPAARQFIDQVGYPVVAKPDIGVGAARTYRIANETDLEAFLGDRPPIDYFMEEFLEGTLLSYDGLVDRDGRVVFDSSLVYGVTVLDSVRGADMYYWIEREIADDLREVGRRVIDAFEVRERPFHFEFFRLDDGDLAALEVNMRQPGGPTVDLWNWANDIDFYRAWAEVVARGTTEVRTARPFYTLWAGRRTGRSYALSHDEVLGEFGPLLIHHDGIDDVFSAAMGNYGYVLRGPELEPLVAAAHRIQAKAA
ncbi:MAG: ATP-grasp domain-containing protein [Chloroflexi bacterium]|nr:ATP-grasp domain-containing protein [Chloroflexota bacterium]